MTKTTAQVQTRLEYFALAVVQSWKLSAGEMSKTEELGDLNFSFQWLCARSRRRGTSWCGIPSLITKMELC